MTRFAFAPAGAAIAPAPSPVSVRKPNPLDADFSSLRREGHMSEGKLIPYLQLNAESPQSHPEVLLISLSFHRGFILISQRSCSIAVIMELTSQSHRPKPVLALLGIACAGLAVPAGAWFILCSPALCIAGFFLGLWSLSANERFHGLGVLAATSSFGLLWPCAIMACFFPW